MKKLLLLGLMLCLTTVAFADEIIIQRGDVNTGFSLVADEVANRTTPHMSIRCQFAAFDAQTRNTERGNFTALTIPGYPSSREVGNPSLPMMTRIIEIPLGATPVVNVTSRTEQEYTLSELGITTPLMPAQPSQRKDTEEQAFVYNEAAYQSNGYTRAPLATVTEIGIMRNMRLVLLTIAPVAYNPVLGKIVVSNNIDVEISLEGANLAETMAMYTNYASPYFDWARSSVMIPPSLSAQRSDVATAPIHYAIVADRKFENDLKPFVAWKTQKGFYVSQGYTDTIGTSREAIQAYLHGLYKNPAAGQAAPTFVLLVGDNEQIPAFTGTEGSYVTDLNYVTVTPDKIPDMLCGRFSAQTSADLIPQIEKTLEYEQYRMPDPSFLKNVVLVAGWDSGHAVEWGWPQINYATKYYFNTAHGYANVNAFLTSGSGQNASTIVSLVSQGASFVNYTAHGSQTNWSDPSFTIANINSLQNTGRYPLVIGNCCLTNSFQVGTCFGEAWLRAKDKGAIGYIGGSSYTYWDEDLWWGNGYYTIAHPNPQGTAPTKEVTGKHGAYNCVFERGYCSNAALMLAGNLAVEESTSPRKIYYWEVYHLMGDPGLMIYLGIPTQMTAEHPADVAANVNMVHVTAEAGAYIGITMNGILCGAGLTGKDNNANIQVSFAGSGTATVVVTKQNRIPYRGTITVK